MSHPQLDVDELRALIARAAVYIGGDSGPLHIAATTQHADRRAVRTDAGRALDAVAGPALVRRVGRCRSAPLPACHQRTCEPGDFRCLTGISPERVVAAAERALAAAEAEAEPRLRAISHECDHDDRAAGANDDRSSSGLSAVSLLGFVAALQVSIALPTSCSSVMLVVLGVAAHPGAIAACPRRRSSARLLAYGALTLVSSAFSLDPTRELHRQQAARASCHRAAVYDIARGSRASTVADVIISVGAASAVIGILQYGVLHYDNLGQRPQGTLSHYMTYSGMLMLVICAAAARLVFGSRDRIWPALVMPALVVALAADVHAERLGRRLRRRSGCCSSSRTSG